MFSWWANHQGSHAGDHTPVVQLHQRYGMILFIASEVMFFVGWFWAFFDFSLFPSTINVDVIGGQWPPKAIEAVMDPFDLPLLNTLILLCSGTTLTWGHHALIHGDRDGLKKGLWATILLGLLFSSIQAYEYAHAPFAFGKNTYGSAFYMATGFHGFHVIVGTIFLIVCLVRAYKGDFTPRQHFGFEAAAWYWHFVDVVWLFLFVAIYVWGVGFPTTDAASGRSGGIERAVRNSPGCPFRILPPLCARTLFAGPATFAPRCRACGLDSPAMNCRGASSTRCCCRHGAADPGGAAAGRCRPLPVWVLALVWPCWRPAWSRWRCAWPRRRGWCAACARRAAHDPPHPHRAHAGRAGGGRRDDRAGRLAIAAPRVEGRR
jgi:cytochrome c oxidase subunit 3